MSKAPAALGAGAAGGAGTGWARGLDLAGGAGGAREGVGILHKPGKEEL